MIGLTASTMDKLIGIAASCIMRHDKDKLVSSLRLTIALLSATVQQYRLASWSLHYHIHSQNVHLPS